MALSDNSVAAVVTVTEKVTPLAKAIAVIGVTYVGWQIYQRLTVAGDAVGDSLGELWGKITNPDIVEAQIRLKGSYFNQSGVLKAEVETLLKEHYPNLYRALFMGGRIKPEYTHLIDSGQALRDSDYV
ncbi:hypothetical protein LG288_05935 [Idiomarina seosinensis]|uniref:hypothetical protein n=1 Tax=Idiomarina seosinensis TaxID=281739 RepID=UPI00384DD939